MQKFEDNVFSIIKTTNLSPAVFSFLQPTDESSDKTPLGGILSDTKYGWLALGPKFCVVDLKSGLKVAAHTFGTCMSSCHISVTSVTELPTPLTDNSKQLVICLECEDVAGLICVLHVNGSQILRCIQTDVVVTKIAVCDNVADGPFSCFDGVVVAGTKNGEVLVFDLNRAALIRALKDTCQGYENLIRNEANPATVTFLPFTAITQMTDQRELALENDDHISVLLNEHSLVDGQYIFRNPDGTVRMKAKRDHIRVSALEYIPQLGSVAIGFNFGAFQIWNIVTCELEFTSQVNVECLPVTHFGFQEPCDDPRAFCYLWVVFSVIDRSEEEEFPLAVMYSLTYQGKRMLSDTKVLYQEFSLATIRFQIELGILEDVEQLLGGRCISCHTYSVNTTLGGEGEDSTLNLCQLVWECWGESESSPAQYGMLLFDLDQWYKDQMPAAGSLCSSTYASVSAWCWNAGSGGVLGVCLEPHSVTPYSHATRLEEHFYPNSLQYNCICLNTSEAYVLNTLGRQRSVLMAMDSSGPQILLNPTIMYNNCVACGLAPLNLHPSLHCSQEEQRSFLLSVALEARLCRFLKRCAHAWASGSHAGVGCTLSFLVDWAWQRALELKEYASELTTPLFSCSFLPDKNTVRSIGYCVQYLTHLTALFDAVLTQCCDRTVPDALNDIEEKYKGVGTVSLYFQVVQWFLRVGLLPERVDNRDHLTYPAIHLAHVYDNRRIKLRRLENNVSEDDSSKPCSLLYIDQLIENELGGDRIYDLWKKSGSETGLYPPPSLCSLLRLYLLPDISEEHKHSLVLYLLVDYSMVYDEGRHESVIRRLMQFPTMFGLSNTAIKATQAFWHLDHRDFDFALDQLQCLTGNTLSDWQHNVVLSSLLAQNKTQAALQYLHVRKPAPIQSKDDSSKVNDIDKLSDWQSCCSLYLARGLVFEALDVVRMCAQNTEHLDDKIQILHFFYNCCRKTGQLSKLLTITLTAHEEEVFTKYLEDCNDSKTSDILVMYYLQQSRYLEAKQYNSKLKQSRHRSRDISTSVESLNSVIDRESTRDALVDILCTALPTITNSLANYVFNEADFTTHIFAPKPMSVFVKDMPAKNTFTYKSSFIQDTIENASETWVNKPKMRKGIKRALNIEEIPFICTPKLNKSRSVYSPTQITSDVTPAKRPKLDLNTTPRTPKIASAVKMSKQMEELLSIPDVLSPDFKLYERSGAETPHSILKSRRADTLRDDAPSPVDSRYFGDTDEELLETESNHTHYSDLTNKHLRFTIPTASEGGSTPSPIQENTSQNINTDIAKELNKHKKSELEKDIYNTEMEMNDSYQLKAPKDMPSDATFKSRKSYKDTVRARPSLSASSLSDDPNTSIESIADIPITLINPKYSGGRNKRLSATEMQDTEVPASERESVIVMDSSVDRILTPKGRRPIKVAGEVTPPRNRSRSRTPELIRLSPRLEVIKEDAVISGGSTKTSPVRSLRSRSRTPDIEMAEPAVVSSSRSLRRSRSRTPDIEMVEEQPAPSPRYLRRSRSRTPDIEMVEEPPAPSPRNLRCRSKTPEKMSPKPEKPARGRKSLSRIVLEANTFAKTKTVEQTEPEVEKEKGEIECTPMKPNVPAALMNVTISPINKSRLDSFTESPLPEENNKDINTKTILAFTMNETYFEKSVLHSYQSSIGEISKVDESVVKEVKDEDLEASKADMKSLSAFTSINMTDFDKSVLGSYESSLADTSDNNPETKLLKMKDSTENASKSVLKDVSSLMTSDSEMELKEDSDIQKEKERIVEIEREISEIEGDMSDDHNSEVQEDGSESSDSDEDDGDDDEEDSESDADASEEDEDEEVISIADTESDESSSNDKLEIDEASNEHKETQTRPQEIEAENTENIAQVYVEEAKKSDESKEHEDPLVTEIIKESDKPTEQLTETEKENEASTEQLKGNQSNYSLMTDDNSVLESDSSDIALNYSDEKAADEKEIEEEMETDIVEAIEINVVVEPITVVETVPEIHPDTSQSVDVVDAIEIREKPIEAMDSESKTVEKPTETIEKDTVKPDEEKPKPKGRRRANSTASNQSINIGTETEPQTPVARKRTKSISSNKSATESENTDIGNERELKTPENKDTPSRKRAKTPTSIEVRKIITRRASKELSEKFDESKEIEEVLTPERRSTRSRSKNLDDNASVVSDISVKSSASRSETDIKPAQVRKGRKSILATKPDLSVIPENTVEDSKVDGSEDVINDYSSSRRLTRHQKSVLSSLMKTKPRSGRTSAASKTSVTSETSIDEEDTESVQSSHINDRLELLNKEDFDGTPDPDEMARCMTPESIASDASKQRRLRRANSETKTTTPKAAKIGRRVSVDIVATPERGSPIPNVDSPLRGRRASFNRACEALHTPKGRRPSTDVKKGDTDSMANSPAGSDASGPVTPARRTRKASTASNTSTRSKKTSDDPKETKK